MGANATNPYKALHGQEVRMTYTRDGEELEGTGIADCSLANMVRVTRYDQATDSETAHWALTKDITQVVAL